MSRLPPGILLLAPAILSLAPASADAQQWVEMRSQNECLEENGTVRLRVDSYGSFGIAVAIGGEANFNPAPNAEGVDWPDASTVYESMSFLCVENRAGQGSRGEWLEHGHMNRRAANFREEDDAMISEFEWQDVAVDLHAELNCNVLTQCWRLTNNTGRELETVSITHYIDADLYFVGGLGNDYGASREGPPRITFQFDQGDDPESPSTYIGLSGSGFGRDRNTSWEIGEYAEQRRRIERMSGGRCTTLRNDFNRSAQADADLDDDLVTDNGFDVTMAQRFDVGPLAAGETSDELCIDVTWGVGYPCGDPDEDGICSNEDNCEFIFNEEQEDFDDDGIGDRCDNCPRTANARQIDLDDDRIGDECDKHVCRQSNEGVEICDGADNDCNSVIDDLDQNRAFCPTGRPGVCASGQAICNNGEMVCIPAARGRREEACNQLDDDCDGRIDEGMRNACGRCGPLPREICNGVDDDCDGRVDQGDVCPEGLNCIEGGCRLRCEGGECDESSDACMDGYCRPRCDAVECPEGLICAEGYGGGDLCVDLCGDVECPEGTVCSLGRCGPCQALGCPEGERCVEGNLCIDDICADVECSDDEACVDGRCRDSCGAISCAVGQSCRSGECVEDPCGGITCPELQVCGHEGHCIADQCLDVECEPGEVCVLGWCVGDPCLDVTCARHERCELACIRGDCFGRCAANWIQWDSGPGGGPPGDDPDGDGGVGEGPPSDCEPGGDVPPPDAAPEPEPRPEDEPAPQERPASDNSGGGTDGQPGEDGGTVRPVESSSDHSDSCLGCALGERAPVASSTLRFAAASLLRLR